MQYSCTYVYTYVYACNSSVRESMVLYGGNRLYMLSEGTDVCNVKAEKKVTIVTLRESWQLNN